MCVNQRSECRGSEGALNHVGTEVIGYRDKGVQSTQLYEPINESRSE